MFGQGSPNRVLELYFSDCLDCAYVWTLTSNPYTTFMQVSGICRIQLSSILIFEPLQSIGTELVPAVLPPGSSGGLGQMLFRFSAFNTGTAVLNFAYG